MYSAKIILKYSVLYIQTPALILPNLQAPPKNPLSQKTGNKKV